MIVPLLDVGDIFYGSTTKVLLKNLDVLQNRAIRLFHRPPARTDTRQFEERMNLLPLDQWRLLHLMQTARWMAELGTYNAKRKLTTRSHAEGRCNLSIQKPNRSLYQNSFVHRACKGWKSLSTEMHGRLDRKDRNIDKKSLRWKQWN